MGTARLLQPKERRTAYFKIFRMARGWKWAFMHADGKLIESGKTYHASRNKCLDAVAKLRASGEADVVFDQQEA